MALLVQKKNHESIPEYQISDTRFVTSLSVCTVCIFVWSQFAHTRLFNKGSKEGDICGLTFITKLALFGLPRLLVLEGERV